MDLSPHRVVLIGLLAIPAAIAYFTVIPEPVIAIAVVNVLLIVGSLVYAMSGETGATAHNATP